MKLLGREYKIIKRVTTCAKLKKGELAFFYHSNIIPPGIVELMRVITCGVADPTQFDPNSQYYDPKLSPQSPQWHTVKVKFVEVFPNIVSLEKLKQEFSEQELGLVRRGNRLSVMPVVEAVARRIMAMAYF